MSSALDRLNDWLFRAAPTDQIFFVRYPPNTNEFTVTAGDLTTGIHPAPLPTPPPEPPPDPAPPTIPIDTLVVVNASAGLSIRAAAPGERPEVRGHRVCRERISRPKSLGPAGSALGIHWIGPGAFGPLVNLCAAAHPPLVVVVNELEKAAPAIKAASPGTFVMARITGHDWIEGPGEAAGRQRVRDLAPLFSHVPADCFSIANEWIPRDDVEGIKRGVETYLGALDEAYRNNIEIAVGDLNTGYPDLDKPGVYEALRPLLEMARYLNVHYYARNGDPARDPDALLWVKLVREFPRLRVIIGELGILEHDGAMPHGAAFTAFCRSADTVWSLWRSRLVGAALYTWKGYDGGQWESARWEQDAALYSAWITAR